MRQDCLVTVNTTDTVRLLSWRSGNSQVGDSPYEWLEIDCFPRSGETRDKLQVSIMLTEKTKDLFRQVVRQWDVDEEAAAREVQA